MYLPTATIENEINLFRQGNGVEVTSCFVPAVNFLYVLKCKHLVLKQYRHIKAT